MTAIDPTPRPGGAAPGGRSPAAAPAKPAGNKVRAGHGYANEVRWQGGLGRQPYANRGEEEAREPNLGDEFEAGDRGEHSGNTLEQMRQLRQKP
ncbi:MAG: hypothetical protein ACOVPA_02960 [Rubrivivax sp.]|jgi:hypothetical protein